MGIEADEPGSMWLDGDAGGSHKLVIQQRSPRGYDGVDLLVTAAGGREVAGAALGRRRCLARPAPSKCRSADLSGEFVNKQLDSSGNRLLVMRTPGDSLRVSLARDSLVFAPGEVFKATLEPHALPLPEGGRARLKIQLLGGGKEIWSQQRDVQAGHGDQRCPWKFPCRPRRACTKS